MQWVRPFIFRYVVLEEVHLLRFQIEPYAKIWNLQKELQQKVINERDTSFLILTQHPAVITIGKSGTYQNLLLSREQLKKQNIQFFETDRGGDITFHGPGQLVGYPILNLERFKKDIHWYLRQLEQSIIETLEEFGLQPARINHLTGVWINNKKICAIGIKTTRWVTMHGFALNITTDLKAFQTIIPCGIQDKGITSLTELLGNNIPMEEVITIFLQKFSNVFGVTII
jgi:lipoyl(octanoyl) transferase